MASIAEIQRILEQIRDELPTLINNSQVAPNQVVIVNGLSDLSERLGLVQAGEFRVGNSVEPGLGFTGVRIGYPAFTYGGEEWHVVGVNDDVVQFGLRATDGKALAGGGVLTLDSNGITIEMGAGESKIIKFVDSADNEIHARIYASLFGGTDTLFLQSGNGIITRGATTQIQALSPNLYASRILLQAGFDDVGSQRVASFDLNVPATGSQIVARFNFWGFNVDFNVFGQADDNLIYADASVDMVGIGTNSPGEKLDVSGHVKINGAVKFTEQSATPSDPSSGAQANLYMKADKLVIQYNDGGTVRYKYLDLTGTGVTWVHTTSAP